MKNNNKLKWLLMLIASMLIFGTNGLLVSNISISSAEIVLFRTVFGSLFLVTVLSLRKGFDKTAARADLPYNVFAGLALGMNWVLLFEAYRKASVSIATLIYYCGPMLVMALSPLLFKEKLTKKKVLCLLLVAAGMVLVTGTSGSVSSGGMLFAAGAALLYAFIVICSKKVTHMKGMNLAFMEILISLGVILIYLPLSGVKLPVVPEKSDILWLVIIGVVNTGIAYFLYFSSMQQLSAQTVSIVSYLDPLSSLVFAAMFLPGEKMTLIQSLGAVLILGGAVLSELKLRRSDS